MEGEDAEGWFNRRGGCMGVETRGGYWVMEGWKSTVGKDGGEWKGGREGKGAGE